MPLHGNLKPRKKAEGTVRLMSININCLSVWKRYNYKAEQLRWAMHKFKVDSMGLQEVGVNWKNFTTSNLLASLLRQGSNPIRSVKSFNTLETKNIGDTQRGGTATIINDALTTYVKDTGTDHTHLGQWSWYCLEGEPEHSTRVVTAYAPCGSNASGVSTYFKQAKRYIQNNNLNTTPKKMFREKLCAVLRQWRARGERIVLMTQLTNFSEVCVEVAILTVISTAVSPILLFPITFHNFSCNLRLFPRSLPMFCTRLGRAPHSPRYVQTCTPQSPDLVCIRQDFGYCPRPNSRYLVLSSCHLRPIPRKAYSARFWVLSTAKFTLFGLIVSSSMPYSTQKASQLTNFLEVGMEVAILTVISSAASLILLFPITFHDFSCNLRLFPRSLPMVCTQCRHTGVARCAPLCLTPLTCSDLQQ